MAKWDERVLETQKRTRRGTGLHKVMVKFAPASLPDAKKPYNLKAVFQPELERMTQICCFLVRVIRVFRRVR